MSKNEDRWMSFLKHSSWMKQRKNRRKARFYKKLSRMQGRSWFASYVAFENHVDRYLYSVTVLGIKPNDYPLKLEITSSNE